MNNIEAIGKLLQMLPRETYCTLKITDELNWLSIKNTWREGGLIKVLL